jgi:hypothetical protein
MIPNGVNRFRERLEHVTITDPTVTEALYTAFDFIWIDAEHNALPTAT